MDDVHRHSATCRLAKSILVWIPRLPTIRVMGSHDMSTSCLPGSAMVQLLISGPERRQVGSRSSELFVKLRSARTVRPYIRTADVDMVAPGGSSMNGMNLSGNPGIVQPMQTPPTLGHPPIPLIQPRLGTLHSTTGPQQPCLTMHLTEP